MIIIINKMITIITTIVIIILGARNSYSGQDPPLISFNEDGGMPKMSH